MKRLTNSYTSPKPLFFRYTSPRLKQNLSSGNAKTLFSHQNISCLYLYAGIYDLTLNDKCSLCSQTRHIGGHYLPGVPRLIRLFITINGLISGIIIVITAQINDRDGAERRSVKAV